MKGLKVDRPEYDGETGVRGWFRKIGCPSDTPWTESPCHQMNNASVRHPRLEKGKGKSERIVSGYFRRS